MLLLSPPLSIPPASLLPMPPLSVTSAGSAGAAAAPGSAGAAGTAGAAAHDDADRLLQQQFRPSSSKLSEMFKPLEDRLSPEQKAALDAVTQRSPRTAAELRAALLRLAQQSPPQADAAAAAALLPPLLGLSQPPLQAAGLPEAAMAAAAAAAVVGGSLPQSGLPGLPGLGLLDLDALDVARPGLQYRCDQEWAAASCLLWLVQLSMPLGCTLLQSILPDRSLSCGQACCPLVAQCPVQWPP